MPEYKERYFQIYRRMAEKVFVPETLVERMNKLRDMIRPYVERDTQKLVTMAQFENAMRNSTSGGAGGSNAAPGLSAGTYTGVVTIFSAGVSNSAITLPVTLTIT
ncbi:MAG: CotH kinase family protein [Acidobacteria bacterium]|nr:CotH kinase family protein [Acidobacteriota bacterium]